MKLHRYTSAADFLAANEAALLRNEAENSLIIGIARGIASGQAGLAMEPYFAAVHDNDGLCIAAFQTLPTKLGITRSCRADALPLLAADIQATNPLLKAVVGVEPTARELADALAGLRGGVATTRMRQRLYDLREVSPLAKLPPGRMRPATVADSALLITWVDGFFADIGDRGDSGATVAERVASGQLYVWDDGGPRSMAAWTGKTPNGARVNFVYSPPELRRRGYATALVAALSQWLLDHGNRFCCLYTDLANPTSNSIYQKIGYRPVADTAVHSLPMTAATTLQ